MRISFAGGGTDLPAYYESFGGMVVSTAINKYVYVIVTSSSHDSLQVSSSDYSTFLRHSGGDEIGEEGKLRYARAFLREFGIRTGYSIFMASEMPPGTGLGSSSSLAVAFVQALAAIGGEVPDKAEVAELACHVEIDDLKMPIGKQDQYASAFGSVNAIHFSAGEVRVEALTISPRTRDWLSQSILLFFTEQSHDSAEILSEQRRRTAEHDPETLDALHEIKEHAAEARDALLADAPDRLGDIMPRSWLAKKRIATGISNERIDSACSAAIKAGASGGKISGAGGGGFLMLACDTPFRESVTVTMERHGLVRADFHLETSGARILVNNAAA